MICQGTASEHCCWVDGKVCEHFRPASPLGERCALRAELGSWTKVYVDGRYPFDEIKCGDWPTVGPCGVCGLRMTDGNLDT